MEEGRLAYRVRSAEASDAKRLRDAIGSTLAHPDHQGRRESYSGAAGRVVTQDDLLTKVWGPAYRDEAHLLRVNIARLRQKVEPEPSTPRYVITRPGIGYSLARQEENGSA